MTKELEISTLDMDSDVQSRAHMNGKIVKSYAREIEEGSKFPPATVFHDGNHYWLADGFHRVKARQQLGQQSIEAAILDGDKRAAILYGVGANATHGLRRTNADKRRAVELLLKDKEWANWSDREIARQCAVSNRLVTNMRTELSVNGSQMQAPPPTIKDCQEKPSPQNAELDQTSTTRMAKRNGKTYPLDVSKIGKKSQDARKPAPRVTTDSPKKGDGPDYLAYQAKVYLKEIDPNGSEGAKKLSEIRDWINEQLGETSVNRPN
ncbi:MAG: ParB/RepB/Spo0J family partition protein [Bacteroidales bacterium]|nr:ParB/RepB/Spo0J family partition protein [Candidatus Latescibacterota bacterium]